MDLVQDAPQTVILAEDEASLYLQATTARVFAPVRQTPVLRVSPQREKTNFYGTLFLETGQEVAWRAATMNGEATAGYLLQLLQLVPDRPILLLWDRAPWHYGAAIQAVLEAHPRLELFYLPTAAPDLNPQEQVWKAARKAVSHNHPYSRLDEVAQHFEEHLRTQTFPCSLLETYGYLSLRPMFI